MKTSALERFLRYVTIDTRSDERSSTVPSTPGQLVLLRQLAAELQSLGLEDAVLDELRLRHGHRPGDRVAGSPAGDRVHRARRHVARDAAATASSRSCTRGTTAAISCCPTIRRSCCARRRTRRSQQQIGHDIVTASGLTLLGADDKAGVAEIVAAAEYLIAHPEIPHGPVRLAFTPDEEIGRGADHFDVRRFGAVCAYTLDGGGRGELELESFSADAVTVTFKGFNTHPGYAKGRMVNAIRLAADFIARLPRDEMSPETTEGYQGYLHPYQVEASVDRTSVKVLVRDFVTAALKEKEAIVERLARDVVAAHAGASVELVVEESYRNMREVLERHPRVVDCAREAIRRAGMEPIERPIRGGTDGSRLSFMGLPTPNLFAGEHNFHSRLEWVSAQDMDKAVEVIVGLCEVWGERAEETE